MEQRNRFDCGCFVMRYIDEALLILGTCATHGTPGFRSIRNHYDEVFGLQDMVLRDDLSDIRPFDGPNEEPCELTKKIKRISRVCTPLAGAMRRVSMKPYLPKDANAPVCNVELMSMADELSMNDRYGPETPPSTIDDASFPDIEPKSLRQSDSNDPTRKEYVFNKDSTMPKIEEQEEELSTLTPKHMKSIQNANSSAFVAKGHRGHAALSELQKPILSSRTVPLQSFALRELA